MLLLYPHQVDRVIYDRCHLHSTMLLLYRRRSAGYADHDKFTFHYASTLSVLNDTFTPVSTLDLHSTMLLLYPWPSPGSPGSLCIYIPLCFYFIPLCSTTKENSRRNLHSTMLLLYPYHCHARTVKRFIYIPLCFYFILQRRTERPCTLHIYIPLCFYFIHNTTWQYLAQIKFTFHYASTLSEVMKKVEGTNLDLHSTMLLLYLRIRIHFPHRSLIYIPLCFYFIRGSGTGYMGSI